MKEYFINLYNKCEPYLKKAKKSAIKYIKLFFKFILSCLIFIKNFISNNLEESFFIASFVLLDGTFFVYLGRFIGLITTSVILFIIGCYVTYIRSR